MLKTIDAEISSIWNAEDRTVSERRLPKDFPLTAIYTEEEYRTIQMQEQLLSSDPIKVKEALDSNLVDPDELFESSEYPEGVYPIEKALHESNIEVVKLLLKAGADPSITDNQGLLPAEYTSNAKIAALLTA